MVFVTLIQKHLIELVPVFVLLGLGFIIFELLARLVDIDTLLKVRICFVILVGVLLAFLQVLKASLLLHLILLFF